MPLQLLGISRSEDVVKPDCSEVRWVVHGPVKAATAWPLPASFGPLEHARVLMAVHRHISILPVRHGTVLPDEQAVQEVLSNRCEGLLRDLDRLAGTSELGLRIEFSDSPPSADPFAPGGSRHAGVSPAAYMAARRARYQWHDRQSTQAQLAADTCVQALSGLHQDWRRLSSATLGAVRLAFIVQRNRAEAFAARVEGMRSKTIGERYTLVGPWPPYSFV